MTDANTLTDLMTDRTQRFAEVLVEYQDDPNGKAYCCRLDGKGYVIHKTKKGYAVEQHPTLKKARKRMKNL